MQPTNYNISYYRGDTFTISVFPKDSSGNPIPIGDKQAKFRLASQRGDNPQWSSNGAADIQEATPGGDLGIFCTMSSTIGNSVRQGYVYDIGYQDQDGTNRVTVLTGTFIVVDKVVTN